MASRIWYLKHCRLFGCLSETQLGRLEHHARMKTFAKGSRVYLPMDPAEYVLLLAEGRVRLGNMTPDGKQAVLAFIEPGELFGELALLDNDPREEYAEAMIKSVVVCLPASDVRRVMEEAPALSLGVTKLIGFRRRRIERRIKNLLFRSNRERLIHLLLELAEQYGERDGNDVRLELRLSHQDLASVIGSTRETVTVILGELREEGQLTLGRQRIVIHDAARLAEPLEIPPVESPRGTTSRNYSRSPLIITTQRNTSFTFSSYVITFTEIQFDSQHTGWGTKPP